MGHRGTWLRERPGADTGVTPPPSLTTGAADRPAPPPDGTCTVDLGSIDAYLLSAGPVVVSQLALDPEVLSARSDAFAASAGFRLIPDLATLAAHHLLTNHQALAVARMAIGPQRTGVVEVPDRLITEALGRHRMDGPVPPIRLVTDTGEHGDGVSTPPA